jgi:serine/threonine-protein kinase
LVGANPDAHHYLAMRDEIHDTLAQFELPQPGATVARGPSGTLEGVETAAQELATSESEFNARYSLLKKHAQGGFGAVWLARDRELDRPVILKQVAKEQAHVLEREAKILGRLCHPNILAIHGAGRLPDDSAFLAAAYIEGGTLQDALDRHTYDDLATRKLLQTFITVSRAVAFAHSKGVVHCDLKPANILLGDFGQVVIADWNLAKLMESEDAWQDEGLARSATIMSTPMGTPAYMAPEQLRGDLDQIGPCSDIYALGGILFQILTGKPANTVGRRRGDGFAEIAANILTASPPRPSSLTEVPPELEAICVKALARDPAHRYESAQPMADAVEAWLLKGPDPSLAASLPQRLLRWFRVR